LPAEVAGEMQRPRRNGAGLKQRDKERESHG
jgi:hypothetical protein